MSGKGLVEVPSVARIAIGSAQFGLAYGIANQRGMVPPDEVGRILQCARQIGIDTVDTAAAYGSSEESLGSAGVADLRVVTKLPRIPTDASIDARAWVASSVRRSLDRLRIPRVHALLLHHPADLEGPFGQDLAGALSEVRAAGLVGRVGVSVYEPSEIARYGASLHIEAVQVPLNVVDRRFVDDGTVARLDARGVEVYARSAFLQGLLLQGPDAVPTKFERWAATWSRWRDWLKDQRMSALQGCLAFALAQPGVHRIVVGIDQESHLTEIAGSVGSLPRANFPDIAVSDPELINPSLWSSLK